jgi:hypothetical protein
VKSFIGQRGHDRMLRVWVEHYGRRAPMAGDDVAGRILAEVFGPRLIEDDYRCYQDFRDEVIAPLLVEPTWTLLEADVREWLESYRERQKQPRTSDTDDARRTDTGAEDAPYATVSWGNGVTRADILQATTSVLLLQGDKPAGPLLPPGSPIRVGLPGTPHMLPARLAAHGQNNRYLIALGSRAVRGAARVRLDLRAIVRHSGAPKGQPVKVLDLSSSGARLRGTPLPVGSEFELSFVPPGRNDLVTLRCVVVRAIGDTNPPEMGVAFCGGTLSFRVDLMNAGPVVAR